MGSCRLSEPTQQNPRARSSEATFDFSSPGKSRRRLRKRPDIPPHARCHGYRRTPFGSKTSKASPTESTRCPIRFGWRVSTARSSIEPWTSRLSGASTIQRGAHTASVCAIGIFLHLRKRIPGCRSSFSQLLEGSIRFHAQDVNPRTLGSAPHGPKVLDPAAAPVATKGDAQVA